MTRFLNAAQVREATPWPQLIDAIANLLVADGTVSPDRQVYPVNLPGDGTGSLLVMPGWLDHELIGVKAATFFPSNAAAARPTIHAAYLCFNGQTGELLAVLDGDEVTARRTAATSALAARSLARADATRLLVIGTGQLSPNIARAHASTRTFEAIEIWGRRPEAAIMVAGMLVGEGLPATATIDLDEAIRRADIISCVTSASQPLVRGERLAAGTHVDLVGSFRADMRESDDAAVACASLFVDTVTGAVESGDLARPLADGVITEESIVADLRSLVAGDHPGRRTRDEITLFKSAGFALADLATARLALH